MISITKIIVGQHYKLAGRIHVVTDIYGHPAKPYDMIVHHHAITSNVGRKPPKRRTLASLFALRASEIPIDTSDIPEVTEQWFKNAKLVYPKKS